MRKIYIFIFSIIVGFPFFKVYSNEAKTWCYELPKKLMIKPLENEKLEEGHYSLDTYSFLGKFCSNYTEVNGNKFDPKYNDLLAGIREINGVIHPLPADPEDEQVKIFKKYQKMEKILRKKL